MREPGLVGWVWTARSPFAGAVRTILYPAELTYRAIVAARGALFDCRILASHQGAVPALSVGNLTVGGTGKTPIAAWAAGVMAARGASPAIVMRGYGDDEPEVHSRLNSGIPVIASPDRVFGLQQARNAGADVAVLDDAFQHRRVARAEDWVLISADRWTSTARLLPAGPWREPLSALRRASVAIVTRKAASRVAAIEVAEQLRRRAPGVPVAIVRLAIGSLAPVAGPAAAAPALHGTRVLLVAAVGDPIALRLQLEGEGAAVRTRIFPDHHSFDDSDIAAIVRDARSGDVIVCTLKDAVKLESRWPRAAPTLWYVSQRVETEDGRDVLDRSLDQVLRQRASRFDAAGESRPPL